MTANASGDTSNRLTNTAQQGSPMAIMLLVAFSMFMEMLDSTVIVTALPTMAQSFNTTAVNLSLGITAYVLATAVLLPATGWIADRYGTRTAFALATAVFTLSSIWCAASHSVPEFVAARTVQGLGAALMSPIGRLVVLRATPKHQLVRILNLLVVPMLIGPVLGPPVGGLLTTYASWHWCFLINAPIGAGILIATFKLIPNLRGDKALPFDVAGFVLNGIGLAALIYGLSHLTEHWPGNGSSYGLIALGIVFGFLAIRHARLTQHPLVDLAAFKIKTFWLSTVAGGSLFRLSIAGPIFLLPLMLQLGMGLTAFQSGLLFLAHSSGDLSTKIITNQLINRLGFKYIFIATSSIFAACMGVCGLTTLNTSFWWLGLVLFIAGGARSLQMAGLNALQFADISPSELTHASTLANIVQQVQRAVGISLAAIVLNFAVSLRPAGLNASLTLPDFRIAFFAMGCFTLSSIAWYARMPKDMAQHLLKKR